MRDEKVHRRVLGNLWHDAWVSSISPLPAAAEASPFSADGGPVGVLVLHGFTGAGKKTPVATLDNDAAEIFDGSLAFIQKHSIAKQNG